jgi:hypothetical protein
MLTVSCAMSNRIYLVTIMWYIVRVFYLRWKFLYDTSFIGLLLHIFTNPGEYTFTNSLPLQCRYSPGWASASFKSFLHPYRFRTTIVQFLHPSLATSSTTPSSQRSLGLPLGRFAPGSLKRTLLDKSLSSWRMTCPAHLRLLSLQNFILSFSPHSWYSSWLDLIRHLPSVHHRAINSLEDFMLKDTKTMFILFR